MREALRPEITAAYAFCRDVAKREAKNFYYAFRVLPQHKSDAMCAVYAFMRKADDLADDESISVEARREAMAQWTERWRASRSGASEEPVFIALKDTQQRFGIGDDLLEQLVAGTTLDLQPQPEGVRMVAVPDGQGGERTMQIYETLEALHRYCYLVASVVGLVCIRIFGYRDKRAEQLAVDTGIAFQLTNILRDVKEDAERGRIYLPQDLLQASHLTPEQILASAEGQPPASEVILLLQGVEQHAQALYRSADELIPLLDKDSQPAMSVLSQIYRRLLDRIAGDTAAVFQGRVSVPTSQKLAILASGLIQAAKIRLTG
jgi:15-cis-phytoene synthase